MLQEPMRSILKQLIGITDEDLDRISPGIQRFLSGISQLGQYKIIAEVIDSKYCAAGVKPGDKIVIRGNTVSAPESTCPLCIGLLGPLMPRAYEMMVRLAEGLDPDEMIFKYSECFDTGLDHGGLGKVHFKLYTEKVG